MKLLDIGCFTIQKTGGSMLKKALENSSMIFMVQAIVVVLGYAITGDIEPTFIVIMLGALYVLAVYIESDLFSWHVMVSATAYTAAFLALIEPSTVVLTFILTAFVVVFTVIAVKKYQKQDPTESFWALFITLLPLGIGCIFGGTLLTLRACKSAIAYQQNKTRF